MPEGKFSLSVYSVVFNLEKVIMDDVNPETTFRVLRVVIDLCVRIYNFLGEWKFDTSLLDILKLRLMHIESLLRGTESRLLEEQSSVKRWLDNVKFAIYDAEELLDAIATAAMRLVKPDKFFKSVGYKWMETVTTVHPYKTNLEIEMFGISERLKDLIAQSDILHLAPIDGIATLRNERLSTSLVNEKSVIYGRETEKEEIIKILNSREGSDDALRVVSIVGMGGIGKTTIARLVYNEYGRSNCCFELKGWACVSDEFEVTRISQLLLESMKGPSSDASNNLELIQQDLKSELQGKRFLLILDDVWNVDYVKWDNLRIPLSVGAPGSRILITTRNESAALLMSGSSDTVYHLKELSKDDCWSLFEGIVFANGESNEYPRLKQLGEEIASRAKGLPLAAKMLGGLLLSEGKDEEKWTMVLNSKIWSSRNNKVIPSLWLSYHHLPIRVKQCFAYCSIFPKGYKFLMEQLVILWMAEGLIEESREVGRSYFSHLRSNSFFKQSDEEGMFVMNDLIHDMAEYASGELLVSTCRINPRSRWLSYSQLQDNILLDIESIQKLPNLRTFLPYKFDKNYTIKRSLEMGNVVSLLSHLKRLRVLSLKGYEVNVLPDSIGNLIHLRYLDLSYTEIESLPKSLCSLSNLQSLNLYECSKLVMLPPNIWDLVNLRCLEALGSGLKGMPDGLSRMKKLNWLDNYIVGENDSGSIRELKELSLHGYLCISGLENIDKVSDIETTCFGNKIYLDRLHLSWHIDLNRKCDLDERVLEAVLPHLDLKVLAITGFSGTKVSSWVGYPLFSNMVKISLTSCYKCQTLPWLGSLPALKYLSIERLNSVTCFDERLHDYEEVPFPSLETLYINDMEGLKTWPSGGLDKGGFPSLVKLDILSCPQLASLPSVGNLPVLKHLTISALNRVIYLDEGFHGKNSLPFPSLEKLEISCMKVLKTWSSGGLEKGGFPSLLDLDIKECPKLVRIPYCYPLLNKLGISGCPKLVEMEMCGVPTNMEAQSEAEWPWLMADEYALQSLLISRCDKWRTAPNGLGYLVDVDMNICKQLSSLPCLRQVEKLSLALVNESFPAAKTIGRIKELEILKNDSVGTDTVMKWMNTNTEIANRPCRKYLELLVREAVKVTESRSDHIFQLTPNISSLNIDGSPRFSGVLLLPELEGFHGLETLPDGLFSSCSNILESLSIRHCRALSCLPESLSIIRSLQQLFLWSCPLIQQFPSSGLLQCTNLTSLIIWRCTALKSLPEELHDIIPLQTLHVRSCPNLVISQRGFPKRLASLCVIECTLIWWIPCLKLHKISALQTLELEGFSGNLLSDNPLPWSITQLKLSNFPHLESLSEVLPTLPRLKMLHVENCFKLRPFRLPNTVSVVTIENCPLIPK